jgi:hypothetical protein
MWCFIRSENPRWVKYQYPDPGCSSWINFRELRNSLFAFKYLNSLMRIRILFDPGPGIRDGKNSDPG